MDLLIFFICFFASTAGGVCGIGGGIIIKPVLDALGIMSVSAISFLSGLTVMSMAAVSVLRQRREHLVEIRTGSFLAAGAAAGGLTGNVAFQTIRMAFGQDSTAGMLQAIVLAVITLLTLLYTVFLRSRLPSFRVKSVWACAAIGGIMGILSAFLGIGGGPINLAVLYIAFSMDTKRAAANSLYIILFSQLSSFAASCVKHTIPEFPWHYLPLMLAGGVLGGLLGSKINKTISSAATDKLFSGLLIIIILICVYNAWRFAG